jgi:hypothetical protein
VVDEFSERYGDLLIGSYDCVDRIVLNAYLPLGHNPGGFRVWWRRLHGDSDEQLDKHPSNADDRVVFPSRAGLGRSAGLPVIDCKRGERKHWVAEDYLASHSVRTGMFILGGSRPGDGVGGAPFSGGHWQHRQKDGFRQLLLVSHHEGLFRRSLIAATVGAPL